MPGKPKANITVRPNLWEGPRHFLERKFRIGNQATNSSTHFRGGYSHYKKADCPNCKRKLSIVWDIDLSDPRFPDFMREGFVPATRLPLLICWTCVSACYQVISDDAIYLHTTETPFETLDKDCTPFINTPDNSPREPLYLTEVPMQIDGLFELYHNGIMNLDQDHDAKRAMEVFYRELGISSEDMGDWMTPYRMDGKQHIEDRGYYYEAFSTFGVHYHCYQGHSAHICPNPLCNASKLEWPIQTYSSWPLNDSWQLMKELALVNGDGNDVLREEYYQLQYFICTECFTVGVEHSCD